MEGGFLICDEDIAVFDFFGDKSSVRVGAFAEGDHRFRDRVAGMFLDDHTGPVVEDDEGAVGGDHAAAEADESVEVGGRNLYGVRSLGQGSIDCRRGNGGRWLWSATPRIA